MAMSCVDISIGARIVAVLGLITSSVVVAQLSRELASGVGDGRVSVLLGLSLDELDSRQRHTLHDHAVHDHLFQESAKPFDTYVRGVLSGFLAFAVLYWSAGALLAYSSIKLLRWGALPWLGLHAVSVASQIARLVVQVAQYWQASSEPEHHSVHGLSVHAMSPHPYHPDHVLEHEREHQVQAEHTTVVNIAVSAAYLLSCSYMWMVVLVAHREWNSSWKPNHRRGLGDEGFSLSMTNIPVGKEALPEKA